MQLNAGHILVKLYHLGTYSEDMEVGICLVQVRVSLMLFPHEFGWIHGFRICRYKGQTVSDTSSVPTVRI